MRSGIGVTLLIGLVACDGPVAAKRNTPSNAVIGRSSMDGAGLKLDQVLVTGGVPAIRTVIAQAYRPSIAVRADGSMIAAIFQPGGDEDVFVATSLDGRSWTPPKRVLIGRDPYLTRLRNGTLLLAHATLSGRGFISTSTDDGATWTEREIPRGIIESADGIGSARGVVELPTGEVLAFIPVTIAQRLSVYVIRSTDHGLTWNSPTLAFPTADEVSAVVLSTGRILAAVRLDGPQAQLADNASAYQSFADVAHPTDAVLLTSSDDDGLTWRPLRSILPPSAVPGHLLRLTDGRVVLSYGARFWPRGAQAIVSDDNGETWDFTRRYILAWHSTDANAGYPWSVQLPSGDIATAYYVRRGSEITAELVRWRP